MPLIRTSLADAIGTIAFDRDTKRNALSAELIAECIAAYDEFKNMHARAVVLRSVTAGKVWSGGHDIDELPKADVDPLPYNDPLEQLLRAVQAFPAPVIAMVQGSVWGGACDLVMACDLVYGDETSSFAITPAKLGLPYNVVGLLNFLSRLPLNVVKEMLFSADPIAADLAERVGIVNRIEAIAGFYKDWATQGEGLNFLCYGDFPARSIFDTAGFMVPRGAIVGRDLSHIEPVDLADPAQIQSS